MKSRLTLLAGSLLVAACATPPQPASAPAVVSPASAPGAELPPPAPVEPASAPVVAPPPGRPVSKPIQPPAVLQEGQGRALLERLLPQGIPDRKGWSNDIMGAFSHLKIPYTPQFFCAVLAVAEQESGFSPDPVVPNLSKIVWGEIDQRRQKYLIPQFVVDAAMSKKSPDGRTFKQRVDALRTKREMNALYEDMVRELPFGQTIFEHKNPIRDGGPMQVSVAFAETHVRAWPYPYSYASLRDEVFTRRGSVYFGTAILLQYPAPYHDMVYRFADFNAGRYASRNAAFQQAVAKLSGRKLALDGDIMLYNNKMNRDLSGEVSDTQRALQAISGRLGMSDAEMLRDLKLEKLSGFAQSPLYQKVFALAGSKAPREIIPQIVLVSPKFTHKLTTEWFARRVDGRYQRCLARDGAN
ncbi:DUF1615 domain-containing protein [Chromobacterium sp. IIBBL 290-4]|uniref:DUF1615 domain-containing protein n=1 Tax=Chromobacterium sp. IIBBL 290-4 TaxID=2953890 RepID=UPI0020B8A522|nr:DUF1615 family protein [Chromobacterium sp. IIBBL 290-4]UTH72824.1 DUF1615 family protein [Chromobacterium sp. IIBBL 290-4]